MEKTETKFDRWVTRIYFGTMIFGFPIIFFIESISTQNPYRCTATIAFVLLFIFFFKSSRSTTLFLSISAQIIFAPFLAKGIAEAQ